MDSLDFSDSLSMVEVSLSRDPNEELGGVEHRETLVSGLDLSRPAGEDDGLILRLLGVSGWWKAGVEGFRGSVHIES